MLNTYDVTARLRHTIIATYCTLMSVVDACRDHDRWNQALQAIDTGLESARKTAQHISEEKVLNFHRALYIIEPDSIPGQTDVALAPATVSEFYPLRIGGTMSFALTKTIIEWCFKAGDILQGACPYSCAACELYEHIRTFVTSIITNNNLLAATAIARTGFISDHDYSFSGWVHRAQQIRLDINRQYMFTLTAAAEASQRYTYLLNLEAGVIVAAHMSEDSESDYENSFL